MRKAELDKLTLEFLIEDYKVKANHIEGQYVRMWSRFNYFLTIQAGLFLLLFTKLLDPQISKSSIIITPIGIIWCVIWYMFGAQDRYHAATQRKNIEHTSGQIHALLGLSHQHYVGQTTDLMEYNIPMTFYQWRIEILSISKLVAICPIFVIIIWILILFMSQLF